MDNTLKIQGYVFLTSIYSGLLIGIVYDVYRVFRYFLKPKKVATWIEDLIFWILIAFIVFLVLIKSTWGELRGYIFFGLFIGAFLYFKVLSEHAYIALIKLFELLSIPFRWLGNKMKPVAKKFKKANNVFVRTIKDTKKYISIISKKK